MRGTVALRLDPKLSLVPLGQVRRLSLLAGERQLAELPVTTQVLRTGRGTVLLFQLLLPRVW